MKLTFHEFENVLLNDDYSVKEIRHLFNAVKKMGRESRQWVVKWILSGEYPDDEIEGITARLLVEELGFKPMNAFIILDWLKAEPDAAKYYILKTNHSQDPSQQIGQEMLEYLQSHGISQTPVMQEQLDSDVIE